MADGVFDMEELDESENKSYMEVLEEKEYVAARGRGKAEIETQSEMMKMELKHQEEMMKIQQRYAPPETQSQSSGGDSSSKSKPGGQATKKNQENQQGSLSSTGAQPGDRKPGPQGDTGKQSVSERDKQLPTDG